MNPVEQGYKLVAERHAQFVKDHPNNAVETGLADFIYDGSSVAGGEKDKGAVGSAGYVIMKCLLWFEREDQTNNLPPNATGYAGMPVPGPTNFTRNSEVENAETSALGRALAMAGYHAKDQFASEDEIFSKAGDGQAHEVSTSRDATQAQKNMLKARFQKLNGDDKVAWKKFLKETVGKYALSQVKMDDVDILVKALEEAESFKAELEGIEAE